MIKVVILICRLMAPGPCTEDNAVAVILADRKDDGTPCQALGHILVKQLGTKLEATDMVRVACQKDGEPFY